MEVARGRQDEAVHTERAIHEAPIHRAPGLADEAGHPRPSRLKPAVGALARRDHQGAPAAGASIKEFEH